MLEENLHIFEAEAPLHKIEQKLVIAVRRTFFLNFFFDNKLGHILNKQGLRFVLHQELNNFVDLLGLKVPLGDNPDLLDKPLGTNHQSLLRGKRLRLIQHTIRA